MAAEPINIFSCKRDVAGLAKLIRQLAPEAKIVGADNAWERIIIGGKKSWLRKAPVLVFKNDPEYYEGPDWPKQVGGMQGYFLKFPDVPRKVEILRVIGTFQFALATEFEPDLDSNDARLKLLFAVTRHLDGVIFTPSGLRDANGRALISRDGQVDVDAVLPAIPEGLQQTRQSNSETGEAEVEELPPDAQRVTKRALCLAAVAGRGLLEIEHMPREEAESQRKRLLNWAGELALETELEKQELELLQQPLGTLPRQATLDAVWRIEGLVVLGWALGRNALPAYDEAVDTDVVLPAVGFLDLNQAMELLASPTLRSAEELVSFQNQTFALHWRLRQFSLTPKTMDFRTFARECWFGPLDISLARLIDDDLAIGEAAIMDAPGEEVQKASSIASERHLAINWLAGGGKVYSETDVST